jgi:hypothetical protein
LIHFILHLSPPPFQQKAGQQSSHGFAGKPEKAKAIKRIGYAIGTIQACRWRGMPRAIGTNACSQDS